jgi:ATP-dependent protease ClpP protease subunit
MDTLNNNEKTEKSMDSIEKIGATEVKSDSGTFYCLSIIGQIEGHYVLDQSQKSTKYDHILPLLLELEESDKIDGIVILINTLGGDVEAGLAIAEMIASLTKPTASIVLGGGHSIGVPLAVSAKRSFIVPSATMTIHPVRTNGVVLGVPQAFDYLEKMQDRIINFVTSNSNVEEKVLRRLMMNTKELVMDVGSVVEGEKAVEIGLIDRLGGLSDAIESLYELIETSEKRYSD